MFDIFKPYLFKFVEPDQLCEKPEEVKLLLSPISGLKWKSPNVENERVINYNAAIMKK